MTELETSVVVFLCLLAATGLGAIVRPLLPEEHKAHETVQLLKRVVGMLVTSTVLVILDLDTRFTGSILVPSQSMRDALAYLSR